jgi:hypothetical protein
MTATLDSAVICGAGDALTALVAAPVRARWATGVAVAALMTGAVGPGQAADAPPPAMDKSQYSLFNPTPDRLLRELTTDRPDMTESPFTVDAGRVVVETNLFGYARSTPAPDGTVVSAFEFATTNIRVGLTHDTEINVIWQPYGIVQVRRDPLAVLRTAGIGSVDLRAKINLWGNDTPAAAGASALGLLPFVTIPTDRGNGIGAGAVGAGLIVPYEIKLSDRLGLGLNAGLQAVKDDPVAGTHVEWLGSVALGYEWTESFGSYAEVAARLGTHDPRGEVVLVGLGLTYKVHRNLQLDAGVNIGVTPAANRLNPFVGLSARF